MNARVLLVVLLSCCGFCFKASACASLGNEPVRIAREAAIIVWDEQNHRQHFIRRASFETKSQNVGFLVPTPSIPELAEADDNAFAQMGEIMKPEEITKVRRIWEWSIFSKRIRDSHNAESEAAVSGNAASGSLDDAPSVTMVFQQHVAGYDAVVLEARNAAGLNLWLKKHGYQSSPTLVKWLEPYVQKRWKITAFKIPKANRNSSEISSTAVRMSFDTPRPFFPYSEPQTPQSQTKAPRWLQIFLFAPKRMEGLKTESLKNTWSGGKTEWADKLSVAKQADFAKQLALPEANFSAPQWLTVFDDYSSPRDAKDDLFFAPDYKQDRIVPLPHVTYKTQYVTVPLDLIFVVVGLLFVGRSFFRDINRVVEEEDAKRRSA